MFEAFRIAGSIIFDAGNAIGMLRDFNTKLEKTARNLKNIGGAVTGAGTKMSAFITVPILAGIGAAIKGASDMNETISKTEVVFGKAADEVKKWSDGTLKSVGLAKGTALDMAAIYGDMGTSMGLSAKQAKEMSMNLVNLTGDMASFKNMKPDEIHLALTGAFTGETESLKRLGIVMLETNLAEYAKQQGIKKTLKEMTQAEKVQLRYNYILDKAKNSTGDFQRTQDSAANQMRIFTEGVKEGAAKIGVLFLPYFTKAINILNKLLDRFRNLPGPVQKIIVIVGILIAGVGPLVVVIGTLITFIGGLVGAISTIGLPVAIAIAAIIPFIGVVSTAIGIIGAFIIKTGVLQKAFEFLKNLFTSISLVIKSDFKGAFEILTEKMGMSKKEAANFMNKILDAKAAIINTIEFVKEIGRLIKAIFSADKQRIIDLLIKKFGYSKKEAEDFAKKVLHLRDKVIEISNKIKDKFIYWLGVLAGKIKDVSKWIYEHRKEIGKAIERWLDFAKDVGKSIVLVYNLIKNTVKTIKGILDLKKSAEKWGENLIQGFINGIKNMAGPAKKVVSDLVGGIKNVAGFHSPTKEGPGKDSDTWGPNFVKMFAAGISDNSDKVKKAALKIANELNFGNNIPGEIGINARVNGNKMNGKTIQLIINNPQVWQSSDVERFIYKPLVDKLQRAGVRSY